VAALLDKPLTASHRVTHDELPVLLIDAGGDILVRSAVPIEIELLGAQGEWHIELPSGSWGVATSSLVGRAWHGAHHLIDPRTSRPAHGRWTQATVVGRSLRHAELATKLLLLGALVPATLGVEQAWVVDRDGAVH
jgi:thiamine biosynthesis lipoprotein